MPTTTVLKGQTLKAALTPEAYLAEILPLRTPEEIEAVTKRLTDNLFNDTDKESTRVKKLQPYNKVIKTIPNEELTEKENAYIQIKADGSLWKRHLHFKFCGLADIQWHGEGGINTSSKVIDRLENKQEVNVTKYLETMMQLLQSSDPHELAVGLIAASGRRPIEILVRGSFTLATELPEYLNPGYFVNFRGQAKKRDYDLPEDERVEYRIGVLVPAESFLVAIDRLRKMPESRELLDYLKTETEKGTDPEVINRDIDNRRGNSLRRVVKSEFASFLPARHGEAELNNKALRAVYVRLITDRDCPKNIDGLLWASRAVGHFIDESKPDDTQLRHLDTTLGYSDYYADSKVPFLETPKKRDAITNIKSFPEDYQKIQELRDSLNFPNQQATVHYIVSKSEQAEKFEKQNIDFQTRIADLENQLQQALHQLQSTKQQLLDAQDNIADLENQLQEKMEVIISAPGQKTTESDLEAKIEALVVKALEKHLPQQPTPAPVLIPTPTTQTKAQTASIPQPEKTKIKKPSKDYELLSSEELRKTKSSAATSERIRRAFQAICNYNDVQPSNDTRWFIGNTSLRELSGCNGMVIGEWMKIHAVSVDDHNLKYGLGQYHNKRHKNMKVSDVISW